MLTDDRWLRWTAVLSLADYFARAPALIPRQRKHDPGLSLNLSPNPLCILLNGIKTALNIVQFVFDDVIPIPDTTATHPQDLFGHLDVQSEALTFHQPAGAALHRVEGRAKAAASAFGGTQDSTNSANRLSCLPTYAY